MQNDNRFSLNSIKSLFDTEMRINCNIQRSILTNINKDINISHIHDCFRSYNISTLTNVGNKNNILTDINPEINIGTGYQEANPSNISIRTNVGNKLNSDNIYSNNIGNVSDIHDSVSLNISNIYDDAQQAPINTPKAEGQSTR